MDFFKHDITEDEIDAVAGALREGHLVTGHYLEKFTDALQCRFGFQHLALCSSGTSALQIALYAAGVRAGDEVITTPYTGVWTANAIIALGASPVFVDIDRETYNMCPEKIPLHLSERVKAIVPVAVNGNPVDLKAIVDVTMGTVPIICDDIEALGSKRNGKYVGADVKNNVSVGGFWVSKQVTTCGGGMVVSRDENYIDAVEKLTRHGHGRVGNMWEQKFGYNSWLSDPMAAMGCVQIKRFEEKQEKLKGVREMMDSALSGVLECRQVVREGNEASEFIYLVELPEGVDKWYFCDGLEIPVRPYFEHLCDVPHLEEYPHGDCSVAREVSARTIALPFHHAMTPNDIDEVTESCKEALRRRRHG